MIFIPYGKQWIAKDDIESVVTILNSDYLTQGPAISKFENAICEYTGAKYCVVTANATAALHIAVKAFNIEPGMEGITSPNTFVASANCLVYNELKPVFADIERDSYNINPAEIERKVSPRTRVLIPVHFAGRSCDMKKINNIAKKNNLFVIEDAAHAIGSNYEDGTTVGNCKYSDMTIFSFHPVKTITTGEGGAITTNNKDIYEKLLVLRSHGITKNADLLTENPGPWYYEMHDLGFNYRMTDIQASLGLSQLNKLAAFKKRRTKIVKKYNLALSCLTWLKTPIEDKSGACFHLYVVQIDFDRIGKTRTEVMEFLKSKKIGTQVHYIPVHTQPYYKKNFGYDRGNYPIAEEYYRKALSLPLYPKMSDEDIEYVIENVKDLCK